jgi:hypothetical protein
MVPSPGFPVSIIHRPSPFFRAVLNWLTNVTSSNPARLAQPLNSVRYSSMSPFCSVLRSFFIAISLVSVVRK